MNLNVSFAVIFFTRLEQNQLNQLLPIQHDCLTLLLQGETLCTYLFIGNFHI